MGDQKVEDIFELFKSKHRVDVTADSFEKILCRRLMEASDAKEASIWQVGQNGNLTLKYGTNISAMDLGDFFLKSGEGISGAALLSRKTIRISDAWSHHRHFREVDQAIQFRTRSMISAPVLYNDDAYGVINILNHRSRNRFPVHWEDIMTAVGMLYAAALVNGNPKKSVPGFSQARVAKNNEQTVVVGISRAIQNVLSLSMKAATSNVPVLIYGETGTGKELAARRIHENMNNRSCRFLSINCAALNETVLESELFGHVKGAFSGAVSNRKGKFVAASGGTLFLDEIGEMSLSCQVKILRALQEKKVMPVGSDREVEYDAKIIAATNMELEKRVAEGKFRQDLYFRLCGLEIYIPSLRERVSDIPLLVDYFIRQQQTLDPPPPGHIKIASEALRILVDFPWPGNVRQLQQAVMAAMAVCNGVTIEKEDLPGWIERASKDFSPGGITIRSICRQPVFLSQKLQYQRVLAETCYKGTGRWNVSAAARLLNIPRKTLVYRMRRLNLQQQ